MKKFVSLLTVCILLLLSVTCVSAATVNYTYTLSDAITDADDVVGYAVTVTANGTAPGGGIITLEWDSTKVTPATYSVFKKQWYFAEVTDWSTEFSDFASSSFSVFEPDNNATYLDEANNRLGVAWYTKDATTDGQEVMKFYFLLKEGVTTADFDKDTFKAVTDFTGWANITSSGKLDGKDSVSRNTSNGTLELIFNTYKSDEPVDWTATVTTEPAADANYNADTIKYRTDAKDDSKIGTTAPAKKVVVFAKNTTGAKLAKETYGVTFGSNFYPGVADVEPNMYWSIILVDTDGSFLNQTSYSYTARVGTEEAAAGTVNVQ